jgi:hypothetical protein
MPVALLSPDQPETLVRGGMGEIKELASSVLAEMD